MADCYRIERELGRGGMATVYLAQDLRHDRPIALKVMHPELAAMGPERFLREIRTTAGLDHPHILALLDSGQAAGLLWYSMPYVRGQSLRDRLKQEVQLSLEEALRIAREVGDALECAHRQGIVHRDIKPENILLSHGHALVSDFGIAKALDVVSGETLTETGLSLGTPQYMSPEQASGARNVDGRTDVYALGCVLYEMLGGEPPFSGSTPRAVLARHAVDPVPALRTVRPGVPVYVEDAVSRALQKVPADRFATAGEFVRALAEGSAAWSRVSPPHALAPSGEPQRPQRRRAALLGGTILLALAGLVISWLVARRHPSVSTPKMLVVLPFKNLGRAEDQYFAEGLADEIASRLGEVPGLGIISRASAQQYRNTNKTLKQIARELGVAYVIDGSVRWERRPGGKSRVRVTPQLVQTADDRQLWARRFDEELADLFAVQARIAEGVAGALNIALGTPERRRVAEAPTSNLEAYDEYLRGNELFNEGRMVQAVRHYRRSVEMDSSFAMAWARLSQAISTLVHPQPTAAYADSGAARDAAERALALAPGLAETHVALASYNRSNPRAERHWDRAYELDPQNPRVLMHLADRASSLGNSQRALRLLKEAVRYNPRSVDVLRALALRLVDCREIREGLATFDRALAVAPQDPATWRIKAGVYLAEGDTTQFWTTLRSGAERVDPVTYVAHLASVDDMFFALDRQQQDLLLKLSPEPFGEDTLAWGLALSGTALLRSDTARAHRFAGMALRVVEGRIAAGESRSDLFSYLSLAYAHLGRFEEAIRAGLRATREPVVYQQFQLVRVYVLAGRYNDALNSLRRFIEIGGAARPEWGGGSLPGLRLDPRLAPLRRHPRFESTMAEEWNAWRAGHPAPKC